MRTDPIEEWRRLTEHYRALSGDQLRELAADFTDLTESAQQILRSEMRSRGFNDPQSPPPESLRSANRVAAPHRDRLVDPATGAYLANADDPEQESNIPHEYTWKTLLCDCDDWEQAWQLGEVLKRAGIDSWVEGPGAAYHWDLRYPRVLVAADQLDQAREIASRPIPQAIVDASRETVPAFEAPRCPGCRAADPLLENIDPVNAWRCASCGRRWTDPEIAPEAMPGREVHGARSQDFRSR